jgi:hypothetical protein
MIFPGRDERVVRIVRKVIRGLSYHHALRWPLSDRQVWVDIQKFVVPPEFDAEMTKAHLDADVFEYRYAVIDDQHFHSCWVLRFFGRTPFFGIVYANEEARIDLESESAGVTGS